MASDIKCSLREGQIELIDFIRSGSRHRNLFVTEEVDLIWNLLNRLSLIYDHLCGLVVTVPCYRAKGPGPIPSATRFSEK
jgi:hypothetical protein